MEQIDLSRFPVFLTRISDVCRPYLYFVLGVNGNCPDCSAELGKKPQATLMRGERTKCKACGWFGNGRDRTVFKKAKISDSQALFLLIFMTVNADRDRCIKLLDIDPVTYDAWRNRIQPLLDIPKDTHEQRYSPQHRLF